MEKQPKKAVKITRTKQPVAVPTDAVRAVRLSLGLSQEALAGQLQCSTASVRKLESDRRLPKNIAVKENLRTLAEQTGIDLDNPVELSEGE